MNLLTAPLAVLMEPLTVIHHSSLNVHHFNTTKKKKTITNKPPHHSPADLSYCEYTSSWIVIFQPCRPILQPLT
ncbi:hypothetical protein ILYODFUR_017059 [Ilyodon furcidens]|uniref:Uncharacterized protein n=1 Tax=Ilyodon furcidens TaxID=33524 RepID=A0ABV0UGQ5_9TELE